MSSHYSKQKAEERHENHLDDLRNYFLEEALKVSKSESRKHCGEYLSLIADHIDFDETEIPLINCPVCQSSRDSVSVSELRRHESQSENQTEHFSTAHFLHDSPADSHRYADMEDRLAEQPQEMVNACPKLALAYESRTAENFHAVNDVPEA